jgi:fructose-1-phosphate kinase PfkB-like protein
LIATFTVTPALSAILFPDEVEERETVGGEPARRYPGGCGLNQFS